MTESTYVHYWGKDKGYRLDRFSYQIGAMGLPFESVSLDQIKHESMVIFTEKSSGIKTFKRWLNSKEEWYEINLHEEIKDVDAMIEDFKRHKKIILDRTYLESQKNVKHEDFLIKLGAFLESEAWNREKKVIVIAYPEMNYQTDPLFSTYLDRVHVYRLPHFDAIDLEAWVEKFVGSGCQEDENYPDVVKRCYQTFGGQPKLVNMVFTEVNKEKESDRSLEIVEKAIDHVMTYLPNTTGRWRRDLQELCEQSPSIKELLATYAQGVKKPKDYPYRREDLILYMYGWLGYSDYQLKNTEVVYEPSSWGIRSEMHRCLAIQVLQGE